MKKAANCEVLFGAFANKLRCEILSELREGEKCVNDLVVKLKTKQSLVSHNLGILVKAGLISQRREGTFRYYSVNKGTVLPAFDLLDSWTALGGKQSSVKVREHDRYGRAGKSPVHLFVLDKDGKVLISEGRDMELTGFKPGADVGQHFSAQLEDMPEVIAAVKEALGGQRVDRQVAGRGFVFALKILPRLDAKGRPDGCIGAALNIKEVLDLEWKLRESEERWRSLVANAPTVIVAVDAAGRITYINRSLSDSPLEQITGKSSYDFFTPRSRIIAENTLSYVLKTGERRQAEVEIKGLDGKVRWFIARCGPILVKGRPDGMMIILTEVKE